MIRKYKNTVLAIAGGLGLALGQSAGAASVTYDLWHTNGGQSALPEGVTYATVKIDDGGTNDGVFDFTVALVPNAYFTGGKITTFGFNTSSAGALTFSNYGVYDDFGLQGSAGPGCCDGASIGPSEWSIGAKGSDATASFSFTVSGAGLGTIDSIFGVSGGFADPDYYFAAHIQALTGGICGQTQGCNGGSIWVAGGNPNEERPPVPLPATAWLLASGLLGLVGVSRRRKVQPAA